MTSPRPTVLLYGRPGCSLCTEADSFLRPLAARLRFDIQRIDIEHDDALLQRFMFEIPVVAIGDQVIARAPIRAGALEDALCDALGVAN